MLRTTGQLSEVENPPRVRECHQHRMRDSQRRPQISGMFYHMRLLALQAVWSADALPPTRERLWCFVCA